MNSSKNGGEVQKISRSDFCQLHLSSPLFLLRNTLVNQGPLYLKERKERERELKQHVENENGSFQFDCPER